MREKGPGSASSGDTKTRGALFVGTLALFALTFAFGRLSAPTEEADLTPPITASAGELDTAYPHSPAGASLAAAAYQQAFADPAILRPGVLKSRIEAVATREFARRMLKANQPGTDRLVAGPVGEGVRRGVPTAYFAVPIGYRLLSYAPERARVQTWGFTIVGNVSTVEPTAYFGTGTTALVWRDDRWKIAFTQAAFGPTPQLGTPRKGSEGFELQDLARDFHLYGIAP